ncbi:MAG: RNA polymerase, sigma-24 subunit, ECF subfamily [Candidatus Kaiserbacteria bacterium GW2011_GWB1_52_6]|uniref:RNA polymerase, sigma-24 subunit, ECF subfamily n=3 Tax=Candidatus Kaiseribacteriota TaxID=1752734 RepID=A0A0G1XKR2_9BACT|nr:MAG: RNA polymerase, sigma-24 subunit, ECF subfamily [Candidatus Kaiserbacteria bacterium GW2011_GWA2_52_12]KKW27802.1 MAG: RNA polymerase, sigma-24 subunit, ECF subfamily [Candidatus Kaiserbacteria bacterium GW2011_GWB1_52_6]KKW31843.1 MAG: RNA polymerase, sigma-24 subunit, ECF subfamily [Candidatus Kaiserbacteria bacterium GW2011_GWC2_52_8b]
MESDEDLIAAYLNGDEDAFTRLVERHLKSVYSFTLRFVGSQSDAQDIVQESFFKTWKNLKRYSSQSASFKTWLMHIARNTAIDFLRKRKHIPFSEFDNEEGNSVFDNLPDETPLAEELLSNVQDVKDVEWAISQLSPSYREVLLLYYESDLTFEEVAGVLEASVNTVKSRHRRAVIALRKLLLHRK